MEPRPLRRREALPAIALAAGGAWRLLRGGSVAAASSCVLTPEVTEGPYWIANHLTRRNITDGQAGIPLRLRLTVQDASSCRPIERADVEIWHANARGVYSGYGAGTAPSGGGGHATPNDALRYLRGHQRSDAAGLVVFDTIYPGWYSGRTPHIHVKVHVGGSVVHTGQLFFADRVSDAVYRTSHYASHGQPDTTNGEDSIYAAAGGASARLELRRRSSSRGYVGSLTMGVRT
jgi:protocatechuate 3,4-dioxygenase beta subunit